MRDRSVLILAAALLSACGGRPVSQVNVLHEAHNAMSQDVLTVNAKSNCMSPARKPWRALHPVVKGKSSTHVDGIDIGQIKQGRYSIIVDGAASGSPVSCGNFQI